MTPEMLLLCIPVYNQEESQAVLPWELELQVDYGM